MSHLRTVRFSEQPVIAHAALPQFDSPTSSLPLPLPEKHDDALYAKYDTFTAASLGELEFIEEQLKRGLDPKRVNSSGWSALMYAAYLGHCKVCSLLLGCGVSVDSVNDAGRTALMVAAACGNLEIVQLLVGRGAKVDHQDSAGDTALLLAAGSSHHEVAKYLLEAGADPNLKNSVGMTPTLAACSANNDRVLLDILQFGGNVETVNARGENGEALAAENPKILAVLKDLPQQKRMTAANAGRDEVPSLDALFKNLNLEAKYFDLFKQKKIDLEDFTKLTENDLSELGVKAFGPRKKMFHAIERYHAEGAFRFVLQPEICSESDSLYRQPCCEKYIKEVKTLQKELGSAMNELKRANRRVKELTEAIETIRAATAQCRSVTTPLLKEMKLSKERPINLEQDICTIDVTLREISMRLMEIPHE